MARVDTVEQLTSSLLLPAPDNLLQTVTSNAPRHFRSVMTKVAAVIECEILRYGGLTQRAD
jgi:hypothetical protein